MTTGQRIAQKRKELGLSQEALGEKLGVSRQSIYKWESDAALPEIDKLIALSRLFGMSVGVLLGVEEETTQQPREDGELSEKQLQMIEEITARYVNALPKSSPRKKHPFLRFLAIAAAVIAAWQLYAKLEEVDRQYQTLTNQVQYVQRNVESQIQGISTRVENILEAQNSLVADKEVSIAATDLKENLVTFAFRAVPKTFTETTVAYLEVSSQGQTQTFGPYQPGSNQTFSGEVTTSLTDGIALSIVFEDGGVRQTQLLREYYDLYTASLPDLWSLHADFWRMSLNEPYVLEFPSRTNEGQVVYFREVDSGKQWAENEPAAELASAKIGLFKNNTLVAWAEPIEKPDSYHGFEDCQFFRFPDLRVELTEEDALCVGALLTDSYGRTFFRQDSPYHAAENGALLDHFDRYQLDNDLENWVFD